MNNIIKRLISGVLMFTMVFAFSTVSFATEEESVVQRANCSHSWETTSYYEVEGSGINATSTDCLRRVLITQRCTKCQKVYYQDLNLRKPHDGKIISATCNGTNQTHRYLCVFCKTYYNKILRCRGAVHTGICPYLPI